MAIDLTGGDDGILGEAEFEHYARLAAQPWEDITLKKAYFAALITTLSHYRVLATKPKRILAEKESVK